MIESITYEPPSTEQNTRYNPSYFFLNPIYKVAKEPMPRTDEAEHWFNAVYSAVQEIPPGKVTSYGHIALLLGYPQRPRQVGICLKHLPSNSEEYYHSGNVPWQRGALGFRGSMFVGLIGTDVNREPGSAERQAEALREEGIQVETDAMGEFYVDLARFGWFPSVLPSEEDESELEDVVDG